jgi:hypothetical protein
MCQVVPALKIHLKNPLKSRTCKQILFQLSWQGKKLTTQKPGLLACFVKKPDTK